MTSITNKHIVHLWTRVEPNEPWHFMMMEQIEVGVELWDDVQNKRIGTAEEFWRQYFGETGGDKGSGM